MAKKQKFKKIKGLPDGIYYIGDPDLLKSKLKEGSNTYALLELIEEELQENCKTGMFEDYETGTQFYYCAELEDPGSYGVYINDKHKKDIPISSGILALSYPRASEFKNKKLSDLFKKRSLGRSFNRAFACSELRIKNPVGYPFVVACYMGSVALVFNESSLLE